MVLVADDTHLIRAAQAGDTHAFEELVRRHQKPVYRVALRMMRNPTDAEDMAQEALIQAWRGLPSYRGQSAFSTWLYRIVINRCLTALAPSRPQTEELTEAQADPGLGPRETAELGERLDELKRAIGELTPEQRAPLVLRELEGLSYAQVGDVLALTEAAVKGRIHRARLELAERVGGSR